MNRDPLLWAALGAVLVVLASAEYDLARACGFGLYVAAGVPGALDIYAVRALRAGRDVAAVVVTLILVNAASHLVTAGLLPVSVPLVVAVSAVAPLVLWRVHQLRNPVAKPEILDVIQEVPAAPVDLERAPATIGTDVYNIHIRPSVPAVPEAVPAGVRLLPIVARPEAPRHEIPVVVPAAEYARTRVEVHTEYVPEPEASDDPTEPDEPQDELIDLARKEYADLLAEGCTPSIRQLRDTYSIGQVRAQSIKRQLGT
ncbi:hypothetical protein ACIBL5_00525 [Streptomyces sp. NPDC050516]|uniref:hypothetical protein n=1 Tax=Streptomyces sp. NPDC050516 TaxID=3365621 RepID=UPI00378D29A2